MQDMEDGVQGWDEARRPQEQLTLSAVLRGWCCAVAAATIAAFMNSLAVGASVEIAVPSALYAALAAAVVAALYGIPVVILLASLLRRTQAWWVRLPAFVSAGIAGIAAFASLDGRFDERLFAASWWMGAVTAAGGWAGMAWQDARNRRAQAKAPRDKQAS